MNEMNKNKKFWTIGEIDAMGVRGPHEVELKNISNANYPLFIDIDMNNLKSIVNEEIGGKIENLGFNEDWSISLEMFPQVNIHLAFTYYGDEFGDEVEAEFKFYFSGEHVFWVPGEDTATYIDIVMDFLERKLRNKEPFEKNYDTKTDLMSKVLLQRTEPFKYLIDEDQDALSEFLGARVWKTSDGWKFKKEIFPKIFVEIIWNSNTGLDISFLGENLSKNIGHYHVEFVGIFLINHILRFITIHNQDKELPDICTIMFSRYYTKQHNWTHRTR